MALSRKDFATAHQFYIALYNTDPNDAVILNNLAWTAGQTKDPKALEYAEKANVLAPNQPSIMDTLGTLLIEKGDTARGIELLRQASALLPNAPDLRLNLAKGLIKANQKDAAKKELEVLAKLGDTFPARRSEEAHAGTLTRSDTFRSWRARPIGKVDPARFVVGI